MNSRSLDARKLAVAFIVSPAMMFLAFLFAFERLYSAWAERNAKAVATSWLQRRLECEATVDSVGVALSSLTLFGVRLSERGERVAEIEALIFEEPSLLALMLNGEIVARKILARNCRSERNAARAALDSLFCAPP